MDQDLVFRTSTNRVDIRARETILEKCKARMEQGVGVLIFE